MIRPAFRDPQAGAPCPSDVDLFLFGRVEAPGSAMPLQVGADGSNALAAQSAGGIDGAYGHIIK